MLIESHNQQYERMLRYLKRLKDQNRSQVEYVDDMWSFFQHCFHLKDWMKNDPSLPKSIKENIEKELNKSKELRIIADLANRSKHFKLTQNIREDADMTGIGVTIIPGTLYLNQKTMEQSSDPCKTLYHIKITTNQDEVFDALSLAEVAVQEWDRIRNKFGIKRSTSK